MTSHRLEAANQRNRTEAQAREEQRILNERARQIAESDWRASGALLPFGYGFLSPKDRELFLARARAEIAAQKIKGE